MTIADRIRILETRLLSDHHYVLKTTRYAYRRANGAWQEQRREHYDRGHGATILLYDLARGTIVLVRQFRFPAFVAGYDDLLVETPAGLLDDAAPEERIRREAEEETGFRVAEPVKIFEAFMSPGAVTERIHFFVAPYVAADRVGPGGGVAEEGEDIEIIEVPFAEACRMMADGRIVDAKTILLIQYAQLHLFQ